MHFVDSHSQTLDNIQKVLTERDKSQRELQQQQSEENNHDLRESIPEHQESD